MSECARDAFTFFFIAVLDIPLGGRDVEYFSGLKVS